MTNSRIALEANPMFAVNWSDRLAKEWYGALMWIHLASTALWRSATPPNSKQPGL